MNLSITNRINIVSGIKNPSTQFVMSELVWFYISGRNYGKRMKFNFSLKTLCGPQLKTKKPLCGLNKTY